MIIFQTDNLEEQIPLFLKGYQALIERDNPDSCGAYIGVLNHAAAGRSLGFVLTWNSSDHEAGQEYFNKIRALGTVIMDTVTSMKPVEFMTMMGGFLSYGTYHAARPIYVETLSDKFIEVFTRSALKLPSDPGVMMLIHQIHGKAVQQD